jgi:hypothetical protein
MVEAVLTVSWGKVNVKRKMMGQLYKHIVLNAEPRGR